MVMIKIGSNYVLVQPMKNKLDKEIVGLYQALMKRLQYHCIIAEAAIKAFKQHFLSILAGLSDSFPWSLWNRLLRHTEVTLHLLRQPNATTNASAYAHMYSNFDYNRMPLAPMGCPCQVHVKPSNRKSWDFHSQKGYYMFTSGKHY